MSAREVSILRLYLLRGTYLLIFVGLALLIWPGVVNPPSDLEHMRGVVRALLAGVSVMALLGLRRPLQMLPILLFELVWKSIWVIAFGVPRWLAGTLTPGLQQTLFDCLITIPLFLVVIPWRYAWIRYVRDRGDDRQTSHDEVAGHLPPAGETGRALRNLWSGRVTSR